MAEPELPLAEVRGSFHRLTRSERGLCRVTMTLDPEDAAGFSAYLDGPQADHLILMRLLPLPHDFKAGPTDPNQGEVEEDSHRRLLKAWDAFVENMTSDVPAQSD